MNKIVLFGTGKIAEVAYYHLVSDSPHEIVAFTVDNAFMTADRFMGLPVVPFEAVEELYPPSRFKMLIAVGYQRLNHFRADRYDRAEAKGYELISYIGSGIGLHGNNIRLGDNCFIPGNQTIQPYAEIGNNVTLWDGNFVGHHSTIGDHCFITAHAVISGGAVIGPRCFIGVNATIGHEVTIGAGSIIGAQALVTRDAEPGSVFIVPNTLKYRLDAQSFLKLRGKL